MSSAGAAREARIARHRRVRERVFGTAEKPRLAVFRSLTHIYAQLIDDSAGRTLASASSLEQREVKGRKSELAGAVGQRLAERALAAGIRQAVFDRGGFQYHGRVRALAEGARKAGLAL
jgi:large subunit ribosomal protein L18